MLEAFMKYSQHLTINFHCSAPRMEGVGGVGWLGNKIKEPICLGNDENAVSLNAAKLFESISAKPNLKAERIRKRERW